MEKSNPFPRLKNAIGMCGYPAHRGDLSWDLILNQKQCLKKRCDYFTWLDLKARDAWRKENGTEKRDAKKWFTSEKTRKEDRYKETLLHLSAKRYQWEWIDKDNGLMLVHGYLFFSYMDNSYVNCVTGARGVKPLEQIYGLKFKK